MTLVKVAFPTDEHFPYQDEKARSVALKIVSDFNPDIRIAGSDGLDFYSVSKFDKDPDRMKNGGLQKEIDAWAAGQREWIDASPNAVAKFIPGNHENRLPKYLWRHPELHGLEVLELKNLLKFKDLGIQETKNDEVSVGSLLIKHGLFVRKWSGYSANAELANEFFAVHTLTGHTHRGGTTYATTRNGVVSAHEGFCLCRLDPEYIANPNWQQGIVLAEVRDNKTVSFEPVPFYRRRNKVCGIWRGKEYVS